MFIKLKSDNPNKIDCSSGISKVINVYHNYKYILGCEVFLLLSTSIL